MELVLASQSPRRREILKEAGFEFHVLPVKISEKFSENLSLDRAVVEVAERKARAALSLVSKKFYEEFLILSSDTIVVLENQIYGKPKNIDEAISHLKGLSGKMHSVKTSYCFLPSNSDGLVSGVETTQVFFKPLSTEEIQNYVATGDPMDKAGAYGIQGIGKNFVEKFEGSFKNVMGLPIEKILEIIDSKGWVIDKIKS